MKYTTLVGERDEEYPTFMGDFKGDIFLTPSLSFKTKHPQEISGMDFNSAREGDYGLLGDHIEEISQIMLHLRQKKEREKERVVL